MLFTPDEYSEGVSSLYDNNAKVMTLTLSEDENLQRGLINKWREIEFTLAKEIRP